MLVDDAGLFLMTDSTATRIPADGADYEPAGDQPQAIAGWSTDCDVGACRTRRCWA